MQREMHLRKWLFKKKGRFMKITELIEALKGTTIDQTMIRLYGDDEIAHQKERWTSVLYKALAIYGDREAMLFSAPGRTEVGGNHTDHQLGRVLAASINLDIACVVIPTEENVVRYASAGFTVKPVNLDSLEIVPEEKNTTEALIRGVAAGLVRRGYKAGGFSAYAETDVIAGGGMSSSAAFEVLIGTIESYLYNNAEVSAETIAKTGQYAENVYFMKASGLMDQMACSVGSFCAIDFYDNENPVVEKVDFNPADYGMKLILTDVRASHADLSDEYSAIPFEMKAAAKVMGQDVLSRCTKQDFLANASKIREEAGDRAFLRAYHFLNETERAAAEADALRSGDLQEFLNLVNESGRSSYMFLQNIMVPSDTRHQAVAAALALSEEVLGRKGACRVHGGGFAGTVQAFVPDDLADTYISTMESVFGSGCCYTLRIRDCGGIRIA